MGLLSGLSGLGLGKLEKADVFEKEEAKAQEVVAEEVKKEPPKPSFNENEVLFDKKCECVVCYNKFTYKAVRTGKAKLIGQDVDLRPRYDKFEPAKYDVIVCPKCGYAVLARYNGPLAQGRITEIRNVIGGNVKNLSEGAVFTYDDAVQRYQLALASAIVKKAKDSEKAYICLKMAWIIRGKRENLSKNIADYDMIIKELKSDENEALKAAYEGFSSALKKEPLPIAGMDEMTITYLLAVLAERFGDYDVASKLIDKILTNYRVNDRIKDRTRELKEKVKTGIEMKTARQ